MTSNCLHITFSNILQSMYSYAVRHWAKPADPNIVNAAGLTPLTLATKLGRKDIFEEMLELMKVVSDLVNVWLEMCILQLQFLTMKQTKK